MSWKSHFQAPLLGAQQSHGRRWRLAGFSFGWPKGMSSYTSRISPPQPWLNSRGWSQPRLRWAQHPWLNPIPPPVGYHGDLAVTLLTVDFTALLGQSRPPARSAKWGGQPSSPAASNNYNDFYIAILKDYLHSRSMLSFCPGAELSSQCDPVDQLLPVLSFRSLFALRYAISILYSPAALSTDECNEVPASTNSNSETASLQEEMFCAACGMHHFTDSYMSSVSNFIRNYLKVFAGFLFAPMNFCKTFGSLSNSRPAFETINLRGHVNSNTNGST
ncbi:hypothetical protein RHGRI_007850 [Rhododendron griersonianum]|uniref:Uncharacterized protein n=1 Tax=Rhododendron griersonianum TaxID=479676 RepID=A0AAV6KZ28_9ERIC|nr:hypothetical protein RHGRI_007850 [Rhododendron griersonianum]